MKNIEVTKKVKLLLLRLNLNSSEAAYSGGTLHAYHCKIQVGALVAGIGMVALPNSPAEIKL